ncbi:MAG: PDZ domain-containing protein [Bryobacteraceae bacterium]
MSFNAIRISLLCSAVAAGTLCAQDEDVVVRPRLAFAPAPTGPPGLLAFAPASGSFLGVNVQEIDAARARALKLKEERGVEITMVADDSPAAKAGLQKGDVVLEYNGQRVEGTEQFVRLVRETPAGRQAAIEYWRDGRTHTVKAAIGSRRGPQAMGGNWPGRLVVPEIHIPDIPRAHTSWRSQMLGIEAESVDGQLAGFFGVEHGVLVRSVMKGSAAEKAGLKAGDVITKVGQNPVDSPADLSRQLRLPPDARPEQDKPGDSRQIIVGVVRDRNPISVTVSLESGPSDRRGARDRGPVRPRPVRPIVQREERF